MFQTTRWSLVAAAKDRASLPARQALGELYQIYWYPLYAYIRRHGHNHEAAQDLTQEFFSQLMEREGLASVDEKRGRFRSFLLVACRNFLANEHDRATAQKRGGGRTTLPLGFEDADGRYQREPAHTLTPEKLFERRWALALLDAVLARLRAEYAAGGKLLLFETLKVNLTGEFGSPYAELAARLSMTEGAVKVAVHRMRGRYRDLLRDEICQTLNDPAGVEEEIRALFAALGS
jgi:RNA polymerase sigma-70 factor (ECF subfamily)